MATCLLLRSDGKAAAKWIPLLRQTCCMSKVNIKHPRPRIMPRRILEAITVPVYPEMFHDPAKFCSVKMYEKKMRQQKTDERQQVELYEKFLAREALKVFESSGMILAVQAESMNSRKRDAVGYQLKAAGMNPVKFQHDILRQAIQETRWENFSTVLLDHTLLITSEDIRVKQFISLSKKLPELVLLGGIVEDRIMTKEALVRYSELPGIEGLRGELVSLLSHSATRTSSLLRHHQTSLSLSLSQYVKQNSDVKQNSSDSDNVRVSS